jgi:hypothetical protein
MEDRDNPDKRLMMQARNKYGTKRGWRYIIRDASETDKTGVAEFKGAEYRSVNELLRRMLDKDDSKTGEIRQWLDTLKLDNGPRDSAACNKEACDRGFSPDLVTRACRQKNIVRDRKTWRIEKKETAQQQQIFDEAKQEKLV